MTLPQHFRRNGYVTLDVGKIFHFDDPASWTRSHHAIGATSKVAGDPGKDAWYAVEGAAAGTLGDNKVTEKALALLATPRSAPFFLAVGYRQPHTRWVCPKSYFDLYRPASMALPAGFASRPTAPPGVPAAAVRPRNADLFRDVDVTPSMARTATAAYFACISYIDDQVGLLMAALERLQLRDKTVVVLMSDHGYHLGERGRWSKHGSLYELVGRVPLIIDAPGTGGRGRSSPRVVELVDLFPTLVQLAGLPPVAALQGASLVPLLQNPNAARQRPAYAQVGAAREAPRAARCAPSDGAIRSGILVAPEWSSTTTGTTRTNSPTWPRCPATPLRWRNSRACCGMARSNGNRGRTGDGAGDPAPVCRPRRVSKDA